MASNVKIVIVGDGSVGKTSLCNVFVNQSFPTNHDATVFENFSQELYVCGQVWPSNCNIYVFPNLKYPIQPLHLSPILSKKHKKYFVFVLNKTWCYSLKTSVKKYPYVCVQVRDIHIECSKQFKWNSNFLWLGRAGRFGQC